MSAQEGKAPKTVSESSAEGITHLVIPNIKIYIGGEPSIYMNVVPEVINILRSIPEYIKVTPEILKTALEKSLHRSRHP